MGDAPFRDKCRNKEGTGVWLGGEEDQDEDRGRKEGEAKRADGEDLYPPVAREGGVERGKRGR